MAVGNSTDIPLGCCTTTPYYCLWIQKSSIITSH